LAGVSKEIDSKLHREIVADFGRMHFMFNNGVCKKWGVAYFPNLRFVALKLLEKKGVTFEYRIPFIRTMSKRKPLEEMWARMLEID
jgi:hypothetical protein